MNEIDAGPKDYKPDYNQLELNDRARWTEARANYRRLVHLWHPDKYAQRPRERHHAQQKFISLTKSYDSLRTFQREYGRLPFEPARAREAAAETEPTVFTTRNKRKSARYTKERRKESADLGSGLLGRDPNTASVAALNAQASSKALWILSGCGLLAVTVMLFLLLDHNASQKIIAEGREVVRQAPQSEFMPSPAEIRMGETRGAFIRPTR